MSHYTIVDYFGYNLSPQQRMTTIKNAGFDGVILLWADYFDKDYRDFPKYADKAGLFVENTHAPYMQANAIWQDTTAGQDYAEHIIKCMKDCNTYQIPTLVMHPINGNNPLPTTDIGIERFKKITDNAEKYSINLAIENQGNADYIGYIFDRIQSDKLRFCFDSGHEQYYSPHLDLLHLYGDKLIALHLHDNSGDEDAHALPFTGIIDFKKITHKLKEINYKGAIALEILNKGFESIEDPVEFLKIALQRAKLIL